MDHLSSLKLRLSNELARLGAAKTMQELNLRMVWCAQIEKEIAAEEKTCGDMSLEMSDDELLEALSK
jgi:hypothetical protein